MTDDLKKAVAEAIQLSIKDCAMPMIGDEKTYASPTFPSWNTTYIRVLEESGERVFKVTLTEARYAPRSVYR